MTRSGTRHRLNLTGGIAVLALAACSDGTPATSSGDAATDITATDITAADITATDVTATDIVADVGSDTNIDAASDVIADVIADAMQDVADVSDASARCTSGADCAGNPAGAVCDTVSGACVACVVTADTCPAAQHCDGTMHTCVMGCRSDDGCTTAGSTHCDATAHACVACVANDQCALGQLCMGNACVAGCDATHGCMAGQTCCSGGCVDTQNNTANCGACGTACTVPNATAACTAGACAVGTCTAPFGDCNTTAGDGCETNTQTTIAHCGMCGHACPTRAHASSTCAAGACGFTCDAGFADCDGMVDNGCEADLGADPAHCGACATACSTANGTAACHMSVCAIGACDTGFADCDAMGATGCEIDTRVTLAHCGMCGHACAFTNAAASCAAGACVLGACATGFANCDAMAATGCEANTQTDVRNCGGCSNACATGATCTAGHCVFGGGADLTITTATTINATAASASVAAGSTTVTLSNVRGTFMAGQEVLLHQTQGATGPVGLYEFARVLAAGATSLTLTAPVANVYATDATHRAQIVVVTEAGAVTVSAGATLTAPAWDGNVGGILALDAAGAVTVTGTVDMSGRGFRGRRHDSVYRCARGYQGEGHLQLGDVEIASNGSGGGGGGAGQDDGVGGGGGNGAAGVAGAPRSGCGACAECVGGAIPGGAGGGVVGTADLTGSLFLGGAGGEGGADEDGCRPGGGGSGGGIVIVRAASIAVTGAVSSNGAVGGDGDSSCGGCGMGGGAGGAGGAVRLAAVGTVDVGASRVTASGAGGGTSTCGSTHGGAGGDGRVGVVAATASGTSTPAFDRH